VAVTKQQGAQGGAGEHSRQSKLTVSLGEKVLLERIEAVESLGRSFELSIDVIAVDEFDLLPHLGKPVGVSVSEDDVAKRAFNGIITDAEVLDEDDDGVKYRLTARPFTYFMSQNRNFGIHQDKSALEIIKKIFTDAGVSDVDYTKVSKTYAPRKYCVQYRESDFAFITRLMEEEGMYYYWKHTADKHTMVLCDSPSAHEQGKPAALTYNPATQTVFNVDSKKRNEKTKDFLQRFTERVSTNFEQKVTLRDWDFEKPQGPRAPSSTLGDNKHPHDNQEVYLYPGGFVEDSRGQGLAKTLLQAMRYERQMYTGEAQAIDLACGTKLDVGGHSKRLDGTYLITRTYHSIVSEGYRSGGNDAEQVFNTRFEAIPAKTPFQLPRVTPRPTVEGLESAIVTGPKGEEIYTDEYGRVKVRFHWDRSGSEPANSTCWIRVAQFGNLGSVILPRIGQEVMVDFLHGDPDHPVVHGWVFNGELKPVYKLPDNKTRSLWRTRTSLGGGHKSYPQTTTLDSESDRKEGANELRFEDKAGSEEVFLHAEKDMNVRTRHDQTNHVGHNQEEKVFWDRVALVGNDETTEVKKNQKLTVGGNQTELIKAKREVEIKATDKLQVGQSMDVHAEMNIKIEAGLSIELKVGQNSIKIDQSGITIKGIMVKIEGQAMLDAKAPMTQIAGDGMLVAKGGVIMLN
jgi:type VI secretion system secreted protein VgrG